LKKRLQKVKNLTAACGPQLQDKNLLDTKHKGSAATHLMYTCHKLYTCHKPPMQQLLHAPWARTSGANNTEFWFGIAEFQCWSS
jgi:hypothetical protein